MTACAHIIWDWNGTLLDDAWLCLEILNDFLRAQGRPIVSAADYAEEFDLPVRDYYARLGFDLKEPSFEDIAAAFFADYSRRWHECALRAGARAVLEGVAERGVPQSILSAYEHAALEEAVGWFGIGDRFTHVVGLGDHSAGSKAENGARLMKMLDCAPEEVLLVGDVGHDVEVAEEIGVCCVLIATGHQARHRLEATGAPVLDALADVLDLLD